jgi:hypothetical protein
MYGGLYPMVKNIKIIGVDDDDEEYHDITFPACDGEAIPSHLFCLGIEFIRVDIYEDALRDATRLREEIEKLRRWQDPQEGSWWKRHWESGEDLYKPIDIHPTD